MAKSIGIVGGGWFGLLLAFELQERRAKFPGDLKIQLFEASSRLGGPMGSERTGGCIFDYGPQSLLNDQPEIDLLLRRLNLTDQVLEAKPAANNRFIWRAGKLRPIAPHPWTLLRFGAMPRSALVRAMLEPFISSKPDVADESLSEAMSRRLGPHAAKTLAPAIAQGVYAADAQKISYSAAYPKLASMEAQHGSWLKGLKRAKTANESLPKLINFKGGMQTAVDTLAKRLEGLVQCNASVSALHPMGERGVRLVFPSGPPQDFDEIVLCTPPHAAAPLLRESDPHLSESLGSIKSTPVVVVHTVYPEGALPELNGFGFLAPADTGLNAMGCIYNSSCFKDRVPQGRTLLTWMMGGQKHPEQLGFTDQRLLKLVREDLQKAFKVDLAPSMHRIFRWPKGIPQYSVGHQVRVERVRSLSANHPRLTIFNNAFDGVSLPAGILGAAPLSERLLGFTD